MALEQKIFELTNTLCFFFWHSDLGTLDYPWRLESYMIGGNGHLHTDDYIFNINRQAITKKESPCEELFGQGFSHPAILTGWPEFIIEAGCFCSLK